MFFLGPFHIYRDEIEIQEPLGNITKTLLDLVSSLNLAFFTIQHWNDVLGKEAAVLWNLRMPRRHNEALKTPQITPPSLPPSLLPPAMQLRERSVGPRCSVLRPSVPSKRLLAS